jgi:hypothetical protein
MGTNCVWASSHLFPRNRRIGPRADKENKEAGSTFQVTFFLMLKFWQILTQKLAKLVKIILGN